METAELNRKLQNIYQERRNGAISREEMEEKIKELDEEYIKTTQQQ